MADHPTPVIQRPGRQAAKAPASRKATTRATVWARSHAAEIALGTLVVVAVAYWAWFGLTLRNINFDDGVSILAARQVLEHGYPELPSGFLYNRGYVLSYALAGSMSLLGVNDLSIMLPSLAASIGVLLLVFFLAKNLLGLPWIGIAAGALLVTLQIETFYATGPRMYAGLQFFTLLAVYGAWRGYVEDSGRFRLVTVLALIGALLTHKEALVLVPALAASVLAARSLKGKPWRNLIGPATVLAIAAVGIVGWFVSSYPLSNPMPAIVIHDGAPPDRIGLNLSPIVWIKHLGHIEETLPYGLAFVLIAGVLPFVKSGARVDRRRDALAYLLITFALAVGAVSLIGQDGTGARYFYFLLPVYALLACVGALALAQSVWRGHAAGQSRLSRRLALAAVLAGGTVSLSLATIEANGPYLQESVSGYLAQAVTGGLQPAALVASGYGLACNAHFPCQTGLEEDLQTMSRSLSPDDLVVTYAPMETHYVLGRVDGYLRQRLTSEGALTPFPEQRDEYFGAPIIDTVEELQGLVDAERTVWVITYPDTSRLSAEMDAFLAERFTRIPGLRRMLIYVNREAA